MGLKSLLYGDCNLLLPKVKENSIDCIITDPPYGINYKSNLQTISRRDSTAIRVGTTKEQYFSKIQNDDEIPLEWLIYAFRCLKIGGAIYIFCHWRKWGILNLQLEKVGFKIKNMIVLNKSNHGAGDLNGSYAPKHEILLFATKGRHILTYESRPKDVWDVPVFYSGSYHRHPNEKPISWLEPCVKNSTIEGDIILDPFMGSGTTGEVALSYKRKFAGIEIDENFYNIAVDRLKGWL